MHRGTALVAPVRFRLVFESILILCVLSLSPCSGVAPRLRGPRFGDSSGEMRDLLQDCDPGDYEYLVSLRDPQDNEHICGGVLLKPSWVLTSAECLDTSISSTAVLLPDVYVGGTFLRGPFCEMRQAALTLFHKKYNRETKSPYNVALLFIDPPILSLQPVKLHKEPLEEGQVLQSAGWGRGSQNSEFAVSLTEIFDLTVLRKDICEAAEGAHERVGCMEIGLQDICTGNGGGPLLLQGTDELVGVAIDDGRCQGVNKISFYSPVSRIKKWLEKMAV